MKKKSAKKIYGTNVGIQKIVGATRYTIKEDGKTKSIDVIKPKKKGVKTNES